MRTLTVVDKRKIELSNLEKVLFPEDGIVKAELVRYYLKAAPAILRHVKGRPLSFVRYPDGIEGQAFFQKNRPDWAPDWIEYVTLGKEKIDYVVAGEEASLVWIANLACIELHQIHARSPHFESPDYMVFDLDPPDGSRFEQVAEIAFELRRHIEGYGYSPFVKTSGGKGVHILVPVIPEQSFDRVYGAASDVARTFVAGHGAKTTLRIRKEARGGKVLIDIYRNRRFQTIVCPYSLRGRKGAPVSMPLSWESLASLHDPSVFDINTAVNLLTREGDAWETFGAYATGLHPDRDKRRITVGVKKSPARGESFEEYSRKRRFEKTPEPVPGSGAAKGDSFVIHRHHAARLHYDLRLERRGVLQSWAVPKGLPPRRGVKRLAVAVEDHPLEYLDFEGVIPKGEYGGGKIWVFARGRYEITREKEDGFYMRLQSDELNAEFRMIHTRDKEWLLERIDPLQLDWLREPVDPMLAQSRRTPLDSPEYLYEVKWDGIRALISLDEGTLTVRSRNRNDITSRFPELLIPGRAFRASAALFDCEIVCLDREGKPVFQDVMRRLQKRGASEIARAKARSPAHCYLFDCLYLDGRPLIHEPLERRREWMVDALRPNPVFRVSEALSEGRSLYEAASRMGLEGVMAKRRNSPYLPGKRSAHWLKIKAGTTVECVIVGYTPGEGGRAPYFGALHLARYEEGRLRYLGKVGSGFDEKSLKSIARRLRKLSRIARPVEEKPAHDSGTIWIEPRLECKVRYSSLTKDGTLREPVFLSLHAPS